MKRYIVRRLLWLPVVLWGIATLVFFVLFAIPGDPARLMAGQHADEAALQAVRARLHLDRPLPERYAAYLGRLARGDLGESYRQRRPVSELIAERFPATALLAVTAVTLASIIGVGAGLAAAARPRSLVDAVAMGLALLGVSMPVFWLGMLLILLFAAGLRWFPVGGYGGVSHLVLPAVTLAAVSAGTIARMTRSSVLENVSRGYVQAARARGLSRRQAILRHAFPNALLPIVTVIGLDLAGLLGGAVATETVFSWPGLGRAIMDAVRARDVPVVEGGVLFLAAVFVVTNLVVDLLYAVLDPRVRESLR